MVYWETWVLFKNSVDTGANLYKELKVLDVHCIIRGFWHIEDLVRRGEGLSSGNLHIFSKRMIVISLQGKAYR